MLELTGRSGAPGRARGRAVVLRHRRPAILRTPAQDPTAQVEALRAARTAYTRHLGKARQGALQQGGNEAAAILDAYMEIAQDDVFFEEVEELILAERVEAPWAVEEKRREVVAQFAILGDEYMRQRADDITNVCRELEMELFGVARRQPFALGEGDAIVFASDLTPLDTLRMDKKVLRGFVTRKGGPTSHTVILAKSLGIPAVVGLKEGFEAVEEGADVLLDGASGRVVVAPDEATRVAFAGQMQQEAQKRRQYEAQRGQPSVTVDGVPVAVYVNWSGDQAGQSLDMASSDGIGLFRTEFLFMEREEAPTEEEQYAAYRRTLALAGGKPVVIRTLDAGGDKPLPYLDLPVEENPFLGFRAIRICLDRPALFKTQLRAVLRASAHGPVSLLFPMVVTLEELLAAKALLAEAKTELEAAGQPYDAGLPVGIMVETPAAVLLADKLARHADFFSIGTNDLTQYTTATDRLNEKMQYLFDDCNLSVLRAVRMACRAAHHADIPVSICGETAGNPLLLPLWVGVGINILSVAPGLAARTRYGVRQLDHRALAGEVDAVLDCDTIEEAKQRLAALGKALDF